jgi:hypothetical protein
MPINYTHCPEGNIHTYDEVGMYGKIPIKDVADVEM